MEETKDQEIKRLQDQLHKQEKLASLGVLSAGIAHEIQNPLNFVINFSKMSDKLLKDLKEILQDSEDRLPAEDQEELDDIVADLEENMHRIVEHGERAIDIIRGILLISRGKEGERIPTDIARMVKEYVWLAYHAMRANHKDFNVAICENYQADMPRLLVIPQDISRAVLNLMNNACYTVWHRTKNEGADYQPTIDVSVTRSDEAVSICIRDNGEGMTEEVRKRLFENFFTTKPVGEGTGLGMGIVRDIVENKHGGQIHVETAVGVGTAITITIPVKK